MANKLFSGMTRAEKIRVMLSLKDGKVDSSILFDDRRLIVHDLASDKYTDAETGVELTKDQIRSLLTFPGESKPMFLHFGDSAFVNISATSLTKNEVRHIHQSLMEEY